MYKNILIRNAKIYSTETSSFSENTDILITDGVIARIEKGIPAAAGCEIVEAPDLCVSAGWTDCHTHIEGFDPFLSYPALGVTRYHNAGGFGANNYPRMHEVIGMLPHNVTSYLYVGCKGMFLGELDDLDNLKEEAFLETVKAYPGEINGAKIRIDPRVNVDTYKSLRIGKEMARKAGLPLIVHPTRTKDSLESVLEVMEKDDVYTHTYSALAPSLFDEEGKIKQCVWDAQKRGVRFDVAHGSNNFSYDIARRAIAQGFVAETISTDMHMGNFSRPGMKLSGVMTKAVHAGYTVEQALNSVIDAPLVLLGIAEKQQKVEVGAKADLTIFRVANEPIDLPDSMKVVETCEVNIQDVATVFGACLTRSIDKPYTNEDYFQREAGTQ